MSTSPPWFWLVGGVLTVATVAGNALVIYLIVSRRRLHTTPNAFVLPLSCADFLFGSCYLPSLALCESKHLSCNHDTRRALVYLLAFISVTNLCAMTLDRYVAIVRPLRYLSIMRQGRVFLLIAAAWLVPVPLYLVPRIVWLHVIGKTSSHAQTIAFYLVHPLVLETLPLFGVIWITGRILFIAHRHSRRDSTLATQLKHNRHADTRTGRKRWRRGLGIRSAQVVLAVVAVFTVCYTSDVAFSVCTLFERCAGFVTPFQLLFRLLWICNSGANPLAYAALKADIRRELKRLCSGRNREKPRCFAIRVSHSGIV